MTSRHYSRDDSRLERRLADSSFATSSSYRQRNRSRSRDRYDRSHGRDPRDSVPRQPGYDSRRRSSSPRSRPPTTMSPSSSTRGPHRELNDSWGYDAFNGCVRHAHSCPTCLDFVRHRSQFTMAPEYITALESQRAHFTGDASATIANLQRRVDDLEAELRTLRRRTRSSFSSRSLTCSPRRSRSPPSDDEHWTAPAPLGSAPLMQRMALEARISDPHLGRGPQDLGPAPTIDIDVVMTDDARGPDDREPGQLTPEPVVAPAPVRTIYDDFEDDYMEGMRSPSPELDPDASPAEARQFAAQQQRRTKKADNIRCAQEQHASSSKTDEECRRAANRRKAAAHLDRIRRGESSFEPPRPREDIADWFDRAILHGAPPAAPTTDVSVLAQPMSTADPVVSPPAPGPAPAPKGKGRATMFAPHQPTSRGGGGSGLVGTNHETWDRYHRFDEHDLTAEPVADPVKVDAPASIQPPNPKYEPADLLKFQLPHTAGTSTDDFRFPRTPDELYELLALAQTPHQVIANRLWGRMRDIANRAAKRLGAPTSTDSTADPPVPPISDSMIILARAINWAKPQWVTQRRLRKNAETNPRLLGVTAASTSRNPTEDGAISLGDDDEDEGPHLPPPAPHLELTHDDPPRFLFRYADFWLEYLASHPHFPVIWVIREPGGRVKYPQELRGLLAVAEMGPAPHVGIRALHWVYCVARVQRIHGLLNDLHWIQPRGSFAPGSVVTDSSVIDYFVTHVSPFSQSADTIMPESDDIRSRSEAIRAWRACGGSSRYTLKVPEDH